MTLYFEGGPAFADLPTSPQGSDHLFISYARDGWRMASEDPAIAVSCWFSGMALVLPTAEWIVTVPVWDEYHSDAPGFPANSQLHSPTSPLGGAAPLACQGASATLGRL